MSSMAPFFLFLVKPDVLPLFASSSQFSFIYNDVIYFWLNTKNNFNCQFYSNMWKMLFTYSKNVVQFPDLKEVPEICCEVPAKVFGLEIRRKFRQVNKDDIDLIPFYLLIKVHKHEKVLNFLLA